METTHEYKVELTNFTGPLDLLLSLIERRELEITEVAVGQVTGDYLRAVSALEQIDEQELVWFLDIATRLLFYKSKALRSLRMTSDEELDNGEDQSETSLAELTEQLRRLQVIREQAKRLGGLFGVGLSGQGDELLRMNLPPLNLNRDSLQDSWVALCSRLAERARPVMHKVMITRLDLAAASKRLLGRLTSQTQINHLLSATGGRRQRVEHLLALLELIKQNLVDLMSEGDEHYAQAR